MNGGGFPCFPRSGGGLPHFQALRWRLSSFPAKRWRPDSFPAKRWRLSSFPAKRWRPASFPANWWWRLSLFATDVEARLISRKAVEACLISRKAVEACLVFRAEADRGLGAQCALTRPTRPIWQSSALGWWFGARLATALQGVLYLPVRYMCHHFFRHRAAHVLRAACLSVRCKDLRTVANGYERSHTVMHSHEQSCAWS
jgi:hypothetical protein